MLFTAVVAYCITRLMHNKKLSYCWDSERYYKITTATRFCAARGNCSCCRHTLDDVISQAIYRKLASKSNEFITERITTPQANSNCSFLLLLLPLLLPPPPPPSSELRLNFNILKDSEPTDGSRNRWRAVQWANRNKLKVQTKLNNQSKWSGSSW